MIKSLNACFVAFVTIFLIGTVAVSNAAVENKTLRNAVKISDLILENSSTISSQISPVSSGLINSYWSSNSIITAGLSNKYSTGSIAGAAYNVASNGSVPSHSPASPVQTFSLTANLIGSGSINNYAEPPAFYCSSPSLICSNSFPSGTWFILYPTPADSYKFTGWSDACTGLDYCIFNLNSDTSVTAYFTYSPQLVLLGDNATPYLSLQRAYNDANNGDQINARNVSFSESLTLNRPIDVQIAGGLGPDFVVTNGYSVLKGKLTLMSGSLRVHNMVIRNIILETISQFITSAQGGTITLPKNGSSVTIPPGIIPADFFVTLSLLSSFPESPPSGVVIGIGPALALTFTPSSSPNTAAPVKSPQFNKKSPSPTDSISLIIKYDSGIPDNFTGAAQLGDVVDLTGLHHFIGVPAVTSTNTTTFSVPLYYLNNSTGINLGSVNLNPIITGQPAPRFGPRIWNGYSWVAFPQGFDKNKKTLFLTHGILSNAETAYSCTNDVMAAGGYEQVVAYDYDYTKRVDDPDVGPAMASFLNTLQAAGLTQIDMEAHSYGGLVSLYAAANTTLKINNMVLEGSPITGTPVSNEYKLAMLASLNSGINYIPSSTVNDMLTSGMWLDLQAGSSVLGQIVASHPETNFVKVVGTKSYLTETNLLFGGSPNDSAVPASSAAGNNLPGPPAFTFDLRHSDLECDPNVIKVVGLAVKPSACSYTYSDWSVCSLGGTQTRTVLTSSPSGCTGTPVLSQSCTPQVCTYTYTDWSACQLNNTQTRSVVSSSPAGCAGTPVLSQACTPTPPACTYTYYNWTECQPDGTQSRDVKSSSPFGCTGTPITSQTCTPVCCACTFDVYCTTYGPGGCWVCHNSSYSNSVCQAPYEYLTSLGSCSCDASLYQVCQ